MVAIIADQVTALEAIEIVRRGGELKCPKCMSVLSTVPAGWSVGVPLHGIVCPVDQQHFFIRCEDESLIKEMRARMKARNEQRLKMDKE